jgi:hypothetical protein
MFADGQMSLQEDRHSGGQKYHVPQIARGLDGIGGRQECASQRMVINGGFGAIGMLQSSSQHGFLLGRWGHNIG